jgi:hypothetical protein
LQGANVHHVLHLLHLLPARSLVVRARGAVIQDQKLQITSVTLLVLNQQPRKRHLLSLHLLKLHLL